QSATSGQAFNNLLEPAAPVVDFAAHARSLGAAAETVADIAGLEAALARAKRARPTSVIVIATDPKAVTESGGAWWEGALSQAPRTQAQRSALRRYTRERRHQRLGA